MSEVNTALADVRQEGSDPFAGLGEKSSTESPAENKQGEEKPAGGDNTQNSQNSQKEVPFHQHPRWIERENELNALKTRDSEREKEIQDLKSFRDSVTKSSSPIPRWFSTLYGENTEAWDAYKEQDIANRNEIKKEILEEQEAIQQKRQEEVKYWDKWVNDEVTKLQTSGKQFDRNELLKVMMEYKPTDAENNLDFEAGLRIYEALKARDANPANSQARKKIADSVTKTSRAEGSKKDYKTHADLRNFFS